jgi:uncharacterized protein YjbI with pentapeptide repeats
LQWAALWECKCEQTNLSETILHGAELWKTEIYRSDLWGAKLQGAKLREVKIDDLTRLDEANFRGACFQNMSLANSPQIEPHLNETFADASVILPDGIAAPAQWAKDRLSHQDFVTAWRDFQRSIGQDPADPK